MFRELSKRNELEYNVKDLESEKEKLETDIKVLQKDLLKSDDTEEQMITEIVHQNQMKSEYTIKLDNLTEKHTKLHNEKAERVSFYEKKILELNQKLKELTEQLETREHQNKKLIGKD